MALVSASAQFADTGLNTRWITGSSVASRYWANDHSVPRRAHCDSAIM